MPRKKKLQPKEVIDALRQAHGMKTGAAEILGVSFPTIERYIAESKPAQEIIEFWRIRRTDRAEYKLDEAIERGDSWAVAMVLKSHNKGRDRGYGDALNIISDGEKFVSSNLDLLTDGQLDRLRNGEGWESILAEIVRDSVKILRDKQNKKK